MKLRRLRKFILITGTTLSLLIAAALVASGWWGIVYQRPRPSGPAVVANSGHLSVTFANHRPPGFRVYRVYPQSPAADPRWPNWRAWNIWKFRGWRARVPVIFVPIYALFLAFAIPTLLAWRFVPRFPPGHCLHCGYNLTGLTEPRCPECGQPFEPKGDAP